MTTLWFLLLLQAPITAAHLDADSGLSQSSIWQVMQDRTGFIWLATASGLNRWDGYQFVTYLHQPENPESLSHNNVKALAEDADGFVWVATTGGLCYFNPTTATFHTPQAFEDTELRNRDVRQLHLDGDTLWIGTRRNLWRYQLQNKQLRNIAVQAPVGSPHPWGWSAMRCFLSLRDHLWIGTEAGLMRYHRETGTFDYMLPGDATASPLAIRSLSKTPDGTIWAATAEGLYGWQENRRDWVHFGAETNGLSDPWINTLLTMPDSTLFVGTQAQGLFRFDPHEATFTPFDIVSPSPWDQNVISLMLDRSGLIWAGTFRTGVYRFDSKPPKFQDVTAAYGLHQSNNVQALVSETNGDLLIGAGSSLYHYQRGSETALRIGLSSAQNSAITEIIRGQGDLYWVGTQAGLFRYDPAQKSLTAEPLPTSKEVKIRALALLTTGLWAATSSGLFQKPPGQDWLLYQNSASDVDWQHIKIRRLLPELNGGLWLASSNRGLIYINRNQTQVKRWFPLPELPDLEILDITRDVQGTLWIGTPYGLFSLSRDQTLTNHGMKNVALGSQINSIIDTPDQRIWLGTPSGLISYDPKTAQIERFGSSEGFRLEDYSANAVTYMPSGQLLIGGRGGIFAFYPERMQRSNYIPQVVFTEIRIFDRSFLQGTELIQRTRLKLRASQNHLSLSFATLDYHAPDQNHFFYKLDGLDTDWIDAGTRNNARYNDLPGGNYTFRVRAADQQGSIPRSEISLAINIRPHFWQQMWFWVIIVFIVLLGIVIMERWRERAIQSRNLQLESLVEERKRELEATKMQLLETAHFAGIHDIANTVLNQMKHELDLIRTSIRQIQTAQKDDGMPALKQATASFRLALTEADEARAERLFATAQSGFQVFMQQTGMARDRIETHTAKLEKHVSTMRETIQLQHSLAKNPLFASEVHLQDMLEDTLKLERGDILRIHVRIKRDYHAEGKVVLPKVKMMKVLTQLVRNSLEAMARAKTVNPTLILRLYGEDRNQWFIEIEDNGPGINPAHLEKVTKQGWSSVGQAGLGLHDCVRALKELKGNLDLQPGEHEEGTRAIIVLPKN